MIHAGGDATGAEVERALVAAAPDLRLPLLTGHVAVDVVRDDAGAVAGLAVLDDRGRPGVLRAPAVLLATGGYGQLYASTTNPDTATGDGLALALRAGATAADLEFVQFHPTVLYTGSPGTGRPPAQAAGDRGRARARAPCCSTAPGGASWPVVHPLADLAPRDVVAAAITRRLAETGSALRVAGRHARSRGSPPASRRCTRPAGRPGSTRSASRSPSRPRRTTRAAGSSPTSAGRTVVPGLYAAGEVARTGLHGANRLASNSLLEGLVVGARAARAVRARPRVAAVRRWAPGPPRRPPCGIADRGRSCSGR